jgi:prepilin-type N-terminal cleavage/methylation domain-containing protein
MPRPQRFRSRDELGFSLIEVLVVVLVVALLAAIAIPFFLGQTGKAKDSIAKSDVKRLSGMVEECKLGKPSYNDCDSDGELNDTPGLAWGNGAGEVRVTGASEREYVATAVSQEQSGGANHVFSIERTDDGRSLRVCNVPGGTAGGCQAGTW